MEREGPFFPTVIVRIARSAVYLASSNDMPLGPIDKPTLSLDAYSMVLAQLTDTADTHPVMHWSKAYKQETFDSARGVWNNRDAWFRYEQDDVFETKLDSILNVIVSGVQRPEDVLSDPAFYVSENDAEVFNDLSLEVVHSVSENGRTTATLPDVTIPPRDFFPKLFKETYGDALDLNQQPEKDFVVEVMHLQNIVKDAKANAFAMVNIRSLKIFAQEYGVESAQYTAAVQILETLFQQIVIPEFLKGENRRALVSVVFTPAKTAVFRKRGLEEADVCYKSEDDCLNGTSSCSNGRGACVASGDCYTCQCKSSSYLGDACEIQDVVADFQLLFWTGVFLTLLTTGCLLFVYNSGGSGTDGVMMVPSSLPKQD
ncbi:hypothetical protein BJV82DRAFT_611348 [Fennellomyces sp. T-0311]|nr:hypothetical protein BJV82DRAFT_611348 [Fennellomyces sp. T-0311]